MSILGKINMSKCSTNGRENKLFERGMIFLCDLGNSDSNINSSRQTGVRPCICIQNNTGNKNSSTIIIIPITKKSNKKRYLPTHVEIGIESGLTVESICLCENIQTISKNQALKVIGRVTSKIMYSIEKAISISLQLEDNKQQIIEQPKIEPVNINKIRKMVESICSLEKFINENKHLVPTFSIEQVWLQQYQDLIQYLKKYSLKIQDYYKPYKPLQQTINY